MTRADTASRTVVRLDGAERGRARRAGWLLVAAFIAFAAAVAMIIVLQPDYSAALDEAAQARGVNRNELPAEAVAPVNREHNPLSLALPSFGVILAALALFVTGVRVTTRVRPDGSRLATAAVVAAGAMPVAWLGIFALETGIGSDDPSAWVGPYDALYSPLIAASTVAGSLAVIATTVLLRRIGVARRTGLVVAALSALLVVVAPVTGAPPIVPLLLGAVTGIVMIRTAHRAG